MRVNDTGFVFQSNINILRWPLREHTFVIALGTLIIYKVGVQGSLVLTCHLALFALHVVSSLLVVLQTVRSKEKLLG